MKPLTEHDKAKAIISATPTWILRLLEDKKSKLRVVK